MEKTNLQDLYPFHHNGLLIEVSDEIVVTLAEAERIERNYVRRVYWNKTYSSLGTGDGTEHEALFVALSLCELYERKVTAQELRAVLNTLPDTQGRKIYAHYILGLSKTEIAWIEDVARSRVSGSIKRGLRNMKKFLKDTL